METYEIKKNVPLTPMIKPISRSGPRSILSATISKMKKGDYFEIPAGDDVPPAKMHGRITSAISYFKRCNPNYLFVTRTLENGNCGVWRIA